MNENLNYYFREVIRDGDQLNFWKPLLSSFFHIAFAKVSLRLFLLQRADIDAQKNIQLPEFFFIKKFNLSYFYKTRIPRSRGSSSHSSTHSSNCKIKKRREINQFRANLSFARERKRAPLSPTVILIAVDNWAPGYIYIYIVSITGEQLIKDLRYCRATIMACAELTLGDDHQELSSYFLPAAVKFQMGWEGGDGYIVGVTWRKYARSNRIIFNAF